MKQFTFDIIEKVVTENYVELKLGLLPHEAQELIDFFPWTKPDYYSVILRNRADDIKITDKIIVSFDINQVDREVSLVGELDSLLSKVQFQNTIWDRQEKILKKIKYLVDYYHFIEGKKAPVAE